MKACVLPEHALLAKYTRGAYTDCYFADVAGTVSHATYVEAFYTTAVFKLERVLLDWFASKPSSDAQARQLAAGEIDAFAAWNVEARSQNQLLLSDFRGRTRSWLMVSPIGDSGAARTRLYFGSAVVPVVSKTSGEATLGFVFDALLGFHKLYSRILLRAASARVAPGGTRT